MRSRFKSGIVLLGSRSSGSVCITLVLRTRVSAFTHFAGQLGDRIEPTDQQKPELFINNTQHTARSRPLQSSDAECVGRNNCLRSSPGRRRYCGSKVVWSSDVRPPKPYILEYMNIHHSKSLIF